MDWDVYALVAFAENALFFVDTGDSIIFFPEVLFASEWMENLLSLLEIPFFAPVAHAGLEAVFVRRIEVMHTKL